MKLKPSIALVAISGLCALTACKKSPSESGSTSSAGGDSTSAVDPKTAEHVLFDSSKMLPPGSVIIDTEEMEMKDCKLTMEMQGKVMEGAMTNVGSKDRIFTFNSEEKVTVVIKNDSSEGSMVMNGEAQAQPRKNDALHDKTVILTKKDGRWSGQLESGEANEDQQKGIDKLAENLNGESDPRHIYGTTPRKVGDTWDVDTAKLSSLTKGAGKAEGTFKMTFDGIEEYQGHECAVLTADVDVTAPTGDGDMVMKMKGKFKIRRSLKHLVDLDNQMEGVVNMTGTINQGAGKMAIEGPMTLSQKSELKLP